MRGSSHVKTWHAALAIRVLVQMENLDLSNFDTIKLVAVTFLLLNSSIRKRPILEWICIETAVEQKFTTMQFV